MLQIAENILLYVLHEIINRNSSQNQKFQKIGYKHLFIVNFVPEERACVALDSRTFLCHI